MMARYLNKRMQIETKCERDIRLHFSLKYNNIMGAHTHLSLSLNPPLFRWNSERITRAKEINKCIKRKESEEKKYSVFDLIQREH